MLYFGRADLEFFVLATTTDRERKNLAEASGDMVFKSVSTESIAPIEVLPHPTLWQRIYGLLDNHAGRILFGLVCLYIITFSVASAYKWETYQTGYDQVYFEQPLWNTSEGRFMQLSDFNYSTIAFTVDFMPGLVLFAPFYWLLPSPHTLFALETIVLALGALPIFWLARDRFKSRPVGLVFALAYFANPTLEYFNLLPFNMRAMGLVCLLYAFYFFEKRKLWPFFLFALLAMSTRTEVSLVVAVFGIYGLLRRAPLKFWLPPLILAPLYFVTVFAFVLPSFIQPGNMVVPPEVRPVQLSPEQINFISGTETIISTTYGDLGKNLPEVVINSIKNPLKTAQRMFTPEKLVYLVMMLLPFAFLSLFSPSALLFALPIVGINLLSSRKSQFDYTSHYSALMLFGLIIGAIYGADNLLKLLQKWKQSDRLKIGKWKLASLSRVVVLLLLFVALVQVTHKNPLPGVVRHAEKKEMVSATNALVKLVPLNASVSASSFLAPHLLPRQYIYNFPLALYHPPAEAVEYFLIDTKARALYLKENNIQGKLPIDFVQQDGHWKLVKSVVVKGQVDEIRGKPREIQLWQRIGDNVPPLLGSKT